MGEHGLGVDHAVHIAASNGAYLLELYKVLLGGSLHWQDCDGSLPPHG
jgi:hypothetical protein